MEDIKKDNNSKRPSGEYDGYKKFCEAMEGHSKDVSAILRCHLLTEYFIDQIIQTDIQRGNLILSEGNFTFSQKLLIAKSLDVVSERVLTATKHLNTVRNSCSHQMDYKISEADVDLIGRPFGKEYSELKKEKKDIFELLRYTLINILAPLEAIYVRLSNAK